MKMRISSVSYRNGSIEDDEPTPGGSFKTIVGLKRLITRYGLSRGVDEKKTLEKLLTGHTVVLSFNSSDWDAQVRYWVEVKPDGAKNWVGPWEWRNILSLPLQIGESATA